MKTLKTTLIATIAAALTLPGLITLIWLVSIGGFDLIATLRSIPVILINSLLTITVFLATLLADCE